MERIEPAARLVDGFGDEIRRELTLEKLFVFKRIVMLGKRHGAGIKPAVDNLGDALHLLAALGAFYGDRVDVGAVKLNIIGAVVAHLFKLGNAAYRVAAAAFALPNIERSSPVTVTGKTPILNIFDKVAEASFAYALGHPVNHVVVTDKVVAYRSHLYEPRFSCVVDEGRVAAPAVGIVMLKLRCIKELAVLFEIDKNGLVRVLDEHTGIGGFGCHIAL